MKTDTKRRIFSAAAGVGMAVSILFTLGILFILALTAGWNPFGSQVAIIGGLSWEFIKYPLVDICLIALTMYFFVRCRRLRTISQ